MRIAMGVEKNKERKSEIIPHLGSAKYMAVYDSEKDSLKIIKVKEVEGCKPILALGNLDNVDKLYCFGIGENAAEICQKKGIKLKTGKFKTIKEVIDNLDKLKELKEIGGLE